MTLTQKPDCLYSGLNDAIGLGPDIKNINNVDPEVMKYHKEMVDVKIPSYRQVKEIQSRYTPKRKSKAHDFFKEKKEAKKTS